uniref:Taurine catabolism dioxygenase TauD n=1 Tax=Cryptococcus bacillisporus CA1280 TaxID=1296109 RepID=A0A0D0UBY1_CRYGA|nr:taurine catabolism dioxygenase TauD [Cryptococcus bacillisporus CA1280]
MASTLTQTIDSLTQKVGILGVRGSTQPIPRNHSLDKWKSFEVTPFIGQEFGSDIQLSQIVNAPNADELIKDLAVLISQRGVVFFRAQDINVDDQKTLGKRLGELSGKPGDSTLHIHPTTEISSSKGDQISIITISFGTLISRDTIWASAYETYSRLSPDFAKFLEGKEAFHEATFFSKAAEQYGIELRTGLRGSPLNEGPSLSAIHPVIRVNPVTGWKGLFVNHGFTRRILGVTKDESDFILDYLFKVTQNNHDLQVRFKWGVNYPTGIADVAIWDNRSTSHSATYDYEKQLRVGDRVVSIGERPYFDPLATTRRETLGHALPTEGALGEVYRAQVAK